MSRQEWEKVINEPFRAQLVHKNITENKSSQKKLAIKKFNDHSTRKMWI